MVILVFKLYKYFSKRTGTENLSAINVNGTCVWSMQLSYVKAVWGATFERKVVSLVDFFVLTLYFR